MHRSLQHVLARLAIPLPCALLAVLVMTSAAAVPSWLAGPPDVERRAERCAVYEWFFAELQRQAEGTVEVDDLARDRLLNIANKLVAHHREAREASYSAEVRYLIFTTTDPVHFELEMRAEALERLLQQPCG
ncbi:hypothetical protein [Sediminicurvatus halobius]|uniref:Uncharacterized protein n=1 Tax=Sediminicurvatus halobius TaxID=2182432 RepID=A0A2U2N8D5_9GAMM|nr:hypothetical protein [Spiribacter halobius]PWG65380.1 hypothetical protein DEM34_01135 [Spiribacter halobius]UEX76398.1 hypothetical protein LMH63_10520 [Spiribacter halobius]